MFIRFSVLLGLLAASTSAEAPLKSGPYPAAGFRPQKPFNLPGEYLPPRELEQQAQQPQKVDVEISKERVDFIGQVQGNTLIASNQPQNAYLPPDNDAGTDDFLQVQELPTLVRPQFLNKQEVFVRPIAQPRPQQPQQQQHNFRPQPQQQNFRPQTQPQNFRPLTQQQNFRSQLSFQSHSQPQQFFPQRSSKPAQQYGLPESSAADINIVYPDPRNLQANDEHDLNAIEALNAAVDAYNRAQSKKNSEPVTNVENEEDADDTNAAAGYPGNERPSRFQQGQYYVLGPDNALQRVMFTTTQDEQEEKTKGFTAQLKYTPVGEIRDPVFKYNERGQLVRILKK